MLFKLLIMNWFEAGYVRRLAWFTIYWNFKVLTPELF